MINITSAPSTTERRRIYPEAEFCTRISDSLSRNTVIEGPTDSAALKLNIKSASLSDTRQTNQRTRGTEVS